MGASCPSVGMEIENITTDQDEGRNQIGAVEPSIGAANYDKRGTKYCI
jgi:hypothetical protein